jgi:hypothetical protein
VATIKLSNFGGMMPAWDPHFLPNSQAAAAQNGYLYSGSLIGWRQPKLLRAIGPATKFVYRIPNSTTNDTTIDAPDCKWLEFSDIDTKVVRTPVVDDQFQRYYFASPSTPPQYNTYDRIMLDEPPWLLGIPAPGCNPGVTVDGGGDTTNVGNPSQATDPDTNPVFIPDNSLAFAQVPPLGGSLLLNSILFLSESDTSTSTFIAALYDDLDGAPFQLIAASAIEVFGLPAEGIVECPFDVPPTLQPNTPYWIAILNLTGYSIARADTVASISLPSFSYSTTYGNGPPNVVNTPFVVATANPINLWGVCTGQGVYAARAYVYTWLSSYGEEGPPSAPTLANGWSNGVWTIDLFQPDPLDQGVRRTIDRKRIYRTVTSTSGVTSYFFVVELPAAQPQYVDAALDSDIAVNDQLASLNWFPPPDDLQGFVASVNGMMVGWRANEVWFAEIFRPHAWPPGYVITTEFPIVGIGVCGSSIVVCTQGTPYVVNGNAPGNMAMTKILLPEPCTHPGSIVGTDIAVLYQSPNGLIEVAQSGAAANLTESWITRERWQALAPVSGSRAIKLTSLYFAFGIGSDGTSSGFTLGLKSLAEQTLGAGYPEAQGGYGITPLAGRHSIGFMPLTPPNGFTVDNVLVDPWTGIGLLIQGSGVYYYDFTDQAPVIVPYIWRSKIYQQLAKKNYEAMKVFFTVPPSTPPQNAERNTLDPQVLDQGQYAILRVYADGQLFTTRELRRSGELLRIYSGAKFEDWQIEVEGRVLIDSIEAATSVKELGRI